MNSCPSAYCRRESRLFPPSQKISSIYMSSNYMFSKACIRVIHMQPHHLAASERVMQVCSEYDIHIRMLHLN